MTNFFLALLLAVLSMHSLSWAADADYRSVYTSLEECDVIESSEQEADPEIDYFTAECPGREGYRIFHIGGDSRSWIVIKSGEETLIDLYNDVMRNQPGAFPYVSGKVAEWRYKGESLIALIFRIAGSDLETQKLKSKLIIRSSCTKAKKNIERENLAQATNISGHKQIAEKEQKIMDDLYKTIKKLYKE